MAFRCGFCHLLRASEYLNPSGSKLSRHCILARHVVFQYCTGVGERQLVSGADLRRLRIPYERITVYKITVPSAKNDIYRTGRFHFGSAHRPFDGVDICRELYDHAVATDLLPDDPFFSTRMPSGCRQVLTYAVMRQADGSGQSARFGPHEVQLALAAHWRSVCVASDRCPPVNDIVHGAMKVSTGVFILSSSGCS